MGDSIQVVIVTLAAAAALLVLIRPLISRDKGAPRPSPGCESCGAAEAHGVQTGSDGSARR